MSTQAASSHALGTVVGSGDANLPRSWFDGICFLEEQIKDRMFKVNADRADARAMRKLQRGKVFGG